MTRVDLPAVMDLAALAPLADALRGTHGPVLMDGAAVERIGASGIQLLLSACASMAVQGFGLAIDSPSAALRSAARTVGADAILFPLAG